MSLTVSILLLVLFAFLASVTQRVTGFGFGIFIMTILPYLLPSYGEATALSGLLAIMTVLLTAIQRRKDVNWTKLLPILITFLVVSFIGVRIVSMVDSRVFKHVLGGILIFVSVYFFFFNGKVHLKPTMPVQLSMGTLSGLMGGLFAMQGPPAVIYFMSCSGDDKNEYMALTSFYFLIGNAMMTVYRSSNGFVTPVVLKSMIIALPAVALGFWVGSKIYARTPVQLLRKLVYGYMAIAGVVALIS